MIGRRYDALIAPAQGGKVHGRRGQLSTTSYTTCGLRIRNARRIELGAEPVSCSICRGMGVR